jgi:hypothetical protein
VRLLKSIAFLALILASGAARADDTDADGVPDDVDACPAEDATGHDLYLDGCVDSAEDFAPFIETLGIVPHAERTLVAIAERVALAVSRNHPVIAGLRIQAIQDIADVLWRADVLTLDQLQAIDAFAAELTPT